MNFRKGTALAVAALAATALATSAAASSAAPATATADISTGTYYQVAQQRILDTRSGNGAPRARVGSGATVTFQVTGRAGIPTSSVAAVVLNLTAVAPIGNTYVTAFPAGAPRPNASNLNLPSGATRANQVTVPVGTGGQVSLYNGGGTVDLLADVMGFYSSDDALQANPSFKMGRQFQLAEPSRLFDSRKDGFPLDPGEVVGIAADFGPTINSTVRALAINVTATAAQGPGYLQIYPGNVTTPPTTSVLNFTQGQTVANMVLATTYYDPQLGWPTLQLRNSPGSKTHALVDVVGFYDQDSTIGLRYRPITPIRIVDTRSGVGGVKAPIGANLSRKYTAPASVAGANTFALVANTTVDQPTANTYLTVYDGSSSRPPVSNLNAARGEVVANATVTPLDDANVFQIYNNNGSTPTIMDVSGAFEFHQAPAAAPAAGAGGTRLAPGASSRVSGHVLFERRASGLR